MRFPVGFLVSIAGIVLVVISLRTPGTQSLLALIGAMLCIVGLSLVWGED